MNAKIRDLDAPLESRIQSAITDLRTGVFSSIRKCAAAWHVSKSTVADRMSGRTSRAISHKHEQILSSAEESTLVRWLSRLTV
ncbi:MAG: hypothetical protein FE78DRAFT_140438, partial [Acidomyces sp. 'richmondensis']